MCTIEQSFNFTYTYRIYVGTKPVSLGPPTYTCEFPYLFTMCYIQFYATHAYIQYM